MLQWRVDGQGKGKPGLPVSPCFSYLCKSLWRVVLVLGAALCGGVSMVTKGCWPAILLGELGKPPWRTWGLRCWICAYGVTIPLLIWPQENDVVPPGMESLISAPLVKTSEKEEKQDLIMYSKCQRLFRSPSMPCGVIRPILKRLERPQDQDLPAHNKRKRSVTPPEEELLRNLKSAFSAQSLCVMMRLRVSWTMTTEN